MSKSAGQIIAIKFTDEITVMSETPVGGYPEIETQEGVWSMTPGYNTVENLRDGNITTYVDVRTVGVYIQIELPSPKVVNGFSVYLGSSYTYFAGEVYGSINGIDFVKLSDYSLSTQAAYNIARFSNYKAYKFYRLKYTAISTRSYVYELKLLYRDYKNEIAFKVTGKQEMHIAGPLLDVGYRIEKVLRHPTIENTIILVTELYNNRFNNTDNNLTVTYDKSFGDLLGAGGYVESFSNIFAPSDLLPVPNPWISDYLKTSLSITVANTKVTHKNGYDSEKVNITVLPVVVVTKVGSKPL